MADDAALRLYRSLVRHDSAEAISVIERARAAGMSQDALFDSVYAPAMAILGGSWADGSIDEYTFTQAAVVADQMMSFVTPAAIPHDTGVAVLIGTMHGDAHDIGKNIVASALRDVGHRTVDLGVNVQPTTFLKHAEETGAHILIVWAETVATALAASRIRELFDTAGLKETTLLVGGGPFVADPALIGTVGADGAIESAESAVRLVARMACVSHEEAGRS